MIIRPTARVQVAVLGIIELLDGQLFNIDHPVAKIIANLDPGDFLATFGRKLPSRGKLPQRTGDRINAFLDLIGFKKEYVCRIGTIRQYRAVPKYDGIDYQEIFDYWLDRDRQDSAVDSVQNPSPALTT